MTDLQTTIPYARRAGADTSITALGHLLTILAGVDDTGGKLTAIEATIRKGLEPPAHIHRIEDEAFYVVDGMWTFTCGDDRYEVGPGGFVMLPHGLPHTFTVDSDGARALMLCWPGGSLEGAFRELGTPVGEPVLPPPPPGPPSPEQLQQVVAAFARNDIDFLPPPDPSAG